MTAKDVKEITPLVTFFSVLERPGKKTVRGLQQPPLVRRGLSTICLITQYFTLNINILHFGLCVCKWKQGLYDL